MNNIHVEILTTLKENKRENNTQGSLNFKNHSSDKVNSSTNRSDFLVTLVTAGQIKLQKNHVKVSL